MKKTIRIFSLFLVLIILVNGCDSKEENDSVLKEINYDEFNEKVDNKDSFILEVVQTGCSNCTAFTPKFKKVLGDNNLEAYTIDISYLDQSTKQDFLDKYKVSGTPTVIFFNEGKDSSTMKRIVGNQSEDVIISKLKTAGYIK